MRLIIFAIYLGVGAMLHALFVGAQFDWTSAWTFGWLFGWPIMVVITFGAGILAIIALMFALVVVWSWFDMLARWREKRRKQAT